MDLRRQLSILRHWMWLLIASALFFGAAAFLISGLVPKTYEGTTRLIVGQSLSAVNPDYTDLLASQRLSQTYAEVATSRTILEQVIAKVELRTTPEELLDRISVEAPRDSTLVRIVASDQDPVIAAAIANAVSEELIAASPAIQGRQSEVQAFIDEDLGSVQGLIQVAQVEVNQLTQIEDRTPSQTDQLQNAQDRLVTLRSTYATLLQYSSSSSSNLLSILDSAVPPTEAASPRVLVNTLLAAIVGLLLAMGIAFLAEYLDDTVKSADDVQATANLPTLGAIAQMKGDDKRSEIYRMATLLYPRSPIAEAYRTLRTNVEFARVDGPLTTLLVTSSVPGEGKTTTASNLAVVFAQAGRRTLLLDADMRKPGVHKLFDLPNVHGLSTLFQAEDTALETLVHPTEQPRLTVMTSGPLPPNPAELLGSHRFGTILERLRGAYDLVLIDSPPLQAVTDAAILGSITDGTLFVINAGRTRRGAIVNGREALAKAGARVLGAVMNRLSGRVQGAYYSYYGYYGGDEKSVEPPAVATGQGRATSER